jgi:DNA-binding transcriptional ArsR family regulator
MLQLFSSIARDKNFPLDTAHHVTVQLHIMRNQMVTYSAEATFSALADPTRRAVLDLLRKGRQPAGQIAQAFPVSRPAISKHLRLLRRAHLVNEHREGRHRFYHLNPEPLRAVDSWLEQYRTFWTTSLNNLKAFVEAEYAKEQAPQGKAPVSGLLRPAKSHSDSVRLDTSQGPKEKFPGVEQNPGGHRPRRSKTPRKGDRHL